MKVKIGDRIFDSSDQPIAVLLVNDEEIEAAQRLGGKGRAIGSFPMNTDPLEAQLFLNSGWGDMTYKVSGDFAGLLSDIELPKQPTISPLKG